MLLSQHRPALSGKRQGEAGWTSLSKAIYSTMHLRRLTGAILLFFLTQILQAQIVSLAGTWTVRLDPDNRGLRDQWFREAFKDSIELPGSCEERGYGIPAAVHEVNRLTRAIRYEGVAWYQRVIEIPAKWKEKNIRLFLERCHWQSTVWIDGRLIGSANSLSVPHEYSLGILKPGKHQVTIAIDNRYKLPIGTWGFAITDDTQGNWNGIIGRMELHATDPVYIRNVQSYRDQLVVSVLNRTDRVVTGELNSHKVKLLKGRNTIRIPFSPQRIWSEFDPVLDTVELRLHGDGFTDSFRCAVGYRELTTSKGQFVVNGRPALMRGPVNECVYPLTGYPPMDLESWKKLFNICRSYGFNFMRFNSWCPPAAAFDAADQLGFYLQVELPFWSIDAPEYGKHVRRDEFLKQELIRILDTYGNHPSFAFMAMGNESPGPFDRLVNLGRSIDRRHLYRCQDGDTITKGDYAERGTEIGQRGIKGPDTNWDRWSLTTDEATRRYQQSELPTLAHEVGQWASYPDFDQISKFTGNLKPYNYERFRSSLKAQGMYGQAKSFAVQSGKFALSLYKEEIEACLRTYPHGGFQVVEARDFPGEGGAMIGWLDAFWDSKGLISPQDFRRFCNETVCLLRTGKRVYQNTENFVAEAGISHYGKADIDNEITWKIETAAGAQLSAGSFGIQNIQTGKYTTIGSIKAPLSIISTAMRLVVTVSAGEISNSWNIWVYPPGSVTVPSNIRVVYEYGPEAREALANGERVLLFSSPRKGLYDIVPAFMGSDSIRLFPLVSKGRSAIPGSFMPAFWDMRLFNQIGTLSILCNPSHPVFNQFPTAANSDWQWADLLGRFTALTSYRVAGDAKTHDWGDVTDRSKCIILNEAPAGFEPIVQMIDNYERNYKLGLVFESKVGKGTLLVCAMDLDTDIDNRPAAKQFKSSLLTYVSGESFKPSYELNGDLLDRILTFE